MSATQTGNEREERQLIDLVRNQFGKKKWGLMVEKIPNRIDELDYLRGFALMGIILVNIIPLLSIKVPAPGTIDATYWRFLYLFVEGRFYTIFTFLFGVGFYIFIKRANQRGKNGYVLFIRRLIVLFLFGLIHVRFQPGEALTVYAVCGLLILPFYKAHRLVNLGFGILMLIFLSMFSFKMLMVIPLMLLGTAAGQFQLFEHLAKRRKGLVIFTVIMFLLAIIGLILQYHYAPVKIGNGADFLTRRFLSMGITIGPIVSAFYAGIFLMLLQVPLFKKLSAPLKNYGRMALTNYVSQTALILITGHLLHLSGRITLLPSLYICLTIYVVQLIFSSIWLHFFRYGPLEWLWRTLTYLEIPKILK